MTTTAGLTENSQAAALASGPSCKSLRERIYQQLISKGAEGATGEETRAALAMNLSTEGPRRGALFAKGKFAALWCGACCEDP